MIITKSVSRFARNTVLLLESVRHLRLLGVDVYFEEQNIHSVSGDGELMLTIVASFAQAESLSASENMKWKIRKGYETGKPNTTRLFGYDVRNGEFSVNEEEAAVLMKIWQWYLEGDGYGKIAKRLNAEGIKTRSGKPWIETTVMRMIFNEKYAGDLLLQKRFIFDHLEKKEMQNKGELPKYYVSGHHEPVIPESIREAVLKEHERRKETQNFYNGSVNRYPLSGKIVCENCGKHYKRKTAGGKTIWLCQTYEKRGKAFCPSKRIPEEALLSQGFDLNSVEYITACSGNRLVFHFRNGGTEETVWKNRSRSESWTAEMKEEAKRKAEEGRRKNG